MKERPIVCTGGEVRAILHGRMTQLRRILKGTTEHKGPYNPAYIEQHKNSQGWAGICPFGAPGHKLWVKETWGELVMDYSDARTDKHLLYRADNGDSPSDNGGARGWTPSIHMPRWASRITLEITGVRVERLQDITEEDAKAEGVEIRTVLYADEPSSAYSYVDQFKNFWSTTHAADGRNGWAANPFVWVITFKKLEENYEGRCIADSGKKGWGLGQGVSGVA